ncbi:MAG TPA: cytochrome c oxidase subunit 3 [Gemmatimonadaceae bacterium]|nr:cytochrome c oxidase subunit 3 [Gemmatimonadaceae bacterium]
MTTIATPVGLPLGNQRGRSPGWWAMVWTIATEAALFAYLLFSYFYLASQSRGAWPPEGPLELRLALPNTIILVLSSVAMIWAERGIRRGEQMRLRIGMLAALVLGLVFIVIQGIEWGNKSFGPQRDAFASLFYTITGFHGAHVIVGLIMNLVVQLWAWRGSFSEERHLAVTNAAMYWHFVDVVWLTVFTSLYLSPRWA